ncbi:MAG: hypothetical protein PCALPYG88_7110 [uncultured Paraburkholderia sp.]|nr:MAG: hypothetical protein PCALPYG08_4499 [uncultured Paraburkholderia sp.]CAH2942075.1 MAG: hypothetical protein PCALPYG88_7110 [uncultured Paraburkholderia sp.]
MSSLSPPSASKWGYQPRNISPDELVTAVSEAVEAALGNYGALPEGPKPVAMPRDIPAPPSRYRYRGRLPINS